MPRFLAATLGCLLLAGCSSTTSTESGLPVVASHYPIAFLAEQVGGDLVDVQTLTAPGTEPHDLELSPQQVGEVQQAATVFYIGGFQPAVDQAVTEASGTAVDLSAGLPLRQADDHGDDHADDHSGADPHVWLDPALMSTMADEVATTFSEADPDNAATYEQNAARLAAQLDELNAAWKSGTDQCRIRTMVVSHEAFGYLADAYGFEQKGIAGLSPETEPSAAAIADLATFVRDNGVTTVYTESLLDPAVAETVAQEAGVDTAVLDPLEGPPQQGDYLSAMRANLDTVRAGQSCS